MKLQKLWTKQTNTPENTIKKPGYAIGLGLQKAQQRTFNRVGEYLNHQQSKLPSIVIQVLLVLLILVGILCFGIDLLTAFNLL